MALEKKSERGAGHQGLSGARIRRSSACASTATIICQAHLRLVMDQGLSRVALTALTGVRAPGAGVRRRPADRGGRAFDRRAVGVFRAGFASAVAAGDFRLDRGPHPARGVAIAPHRGVVS